MVVIPIHTKVWRADVGSMKGAAACVEPVFSGVKRLLGDFAATMSPDILELYVFIHYNWQYEWMQPSIDEIVNAYRAVHGSEAQEDDVVVDDQTHSDGDESDSTE